MIASNAICPERKLPSSRSGRYIAPFVVVNCPFRQISAKLIIFECQNGMEIKILGTKSVYI